MRPTSWKHMSIRRLGHSNHDRTEELHRGDAVCGAERFFLMRAQPGRTRKRQICPSP